MTLLARLEAAEAGSYELDLAIAQWCYDGAARDLVNYDPELWLVRNGGFTDSIDAAKALIERVLPGWAWSLHSPDRLNGHDGYMAWVAAPETTGGPEPWLEERDMETGSSKATPALAMCIALIRAKEAKGE